MVIERMLDLFLCNYGEKLQLYDMRASQKEDFKGSVIVSPIFVF